jgi:uncharacterized membrane protein
MTLNDPQEPDETRGAKAPSRRTTMLALALVTLTLAVIVSMMWLASLNPHPPSGEAVGDYILWVMLGVVYGAVGAGIVIRANHTIGWLFLVIALAFTLGNFMELWVNYTTRTCRGCLPFFEPLLLPGMLIWSIGITSLVLVFHLFPTGRLPAWHGRLIARVFVISSIVWTVTLILRPSEPGAAFPNPYALESLRTPVLIVFSIGAVGALASAAAAIVGLVIRFRRSRGAERQQMKWLSYVGVIAASFFTIGFPTQFVFGPTSVISNLGWSMFFGSLMFGIPIAVGFAVLRYRLYDIDRIVTRTFTYAIVTAVLGAVFALFVVVPSVLLGSRQVPDYVIAAATLVVAALFRPVLQRVRSVVDRRFNRARYSAVQTIEAFAAHLREQVDIDALGAELEGLIAQTMQPSSVVLWLRKSRSSA